MVSSVLLSKVRSTRFSVDLLCSSSIDCWGAHTTRTLAPSRWSFLGCSATSPLSILHSQTGTGIFLHSLGFVHGLLPVEVLPQQELFPSDLLLEFISVFANLFHFVHHLPRPVASWLHNPTKKDNENIAVIKQKDNDSIAVNQAKKTMIAQL